MGQILLEAGANDFGGTLINESISTSAGASFGQLLKPKVIRNIIHTLGKIPAQRKSNYQIIKIFSNDDYFDDELLDMSNSQDFGSYQELIKMDRFKFKKN